MYTPAIEAALRERRPSQFDGMTPDLCLPAETIKSPKVTFLDQIRDRILKDTTLTPPYMMSDEDTNYLLGHVNG